MGKEAGGAAPWPGASHTVHLLAVVTCLATCIVAFMHLSPFQAYVGQLRLLAGGGQAAQAAHLSGGITIPPGWSVSDCLQAATQGRWRRVTNIRRPLPLPGNVASWKAEDTFVFHNEILNYEWVWHPHATACGIRRRSPSEIAQVLSHKRVLFMGDSHVRYLHNWVARTLGGKELAKYTGLDSPLEINQTMGAGLEPGDTWLQYITENYALEVSTMLRFWNDTCDEPLLCRGQPWPDVVVIDGSEWHLFTQKNMTEYALNMWELLYTLQTKVPESTFLVWVSPPPRDEKKKPSKSELPPEWIRLYDRVAGDMGYYKPKGPAYHLDLFQVALDCLPWCTIHDGVHVTGTVNEVMMQQLVNLYLIRQAAAEAAELPAA